MNAGDTFYLAKRQLEEHLWFVLSDPAINQEVVIIANFTTWKEYKDQACTTRMKIETYTVLEEQGLVSIF